MTKVELIDTLGEYKVGLLSKAVERLMSLGNICKQKLIIMQEEDE